MKHSCCVNIELGGVLTPYCMTKYFAVMICYYYWGALDFPRAPSLGEMIIMSMHTLFIEAQSSTVCNYRDASVAIDSWSCCAAKDRERKHAYLPSIIESELILELGRNRMLLSGSVLSRWLGASSGAP